MIIKSADWCQRAGFQSLEDIEPITVAAYIEQHPRSLPTIKQHMAAIRMLFSWPTEKGVLPINPAREVKTPRFSRKEGKTPAFARDQVRMVLESIDTRLLAATLLTRSARPDILAFLRKEAHLRERRTPLTTRTVGRPSCTIGVSKPCSARTWSGFAIKNSSRPQ